MRLSLRGNEMGVFRRYVRPADLDPRTLPRWREERRVGRGMWPVLHMRVHVREWDHVYRRMDLWWCGQIQRPTSRELIRHAMCIQGDTGRQRVCRHGRIRVR